jgi:hypothetical protein
MHITQLSLSRKDDFVEREEPKFVPAGTNAAER